MRPSTSLATRLAAATGALAFSFMAFAFAIGPVIADGQMIV